MISTKNSEICLESSKERRKVPEIVRSTHQAKQSDQRCGRTFSHGVSIQDDPI
ncbi:hypothetical protein BHE74_00057040 [Ensete ventricosum]|uniref:Uncharacterized protein n=1 Tax=Ensete ventricosum TaxID=4639 RepID=A0A426XSH0_ENSVE|nr:hypothetical protein B296_00038948 [Ensete ventricosum]RWV85841.1 hypothetical protein GW17_00052332 [Ensete ventricosum]RWW37797.1 hypothetical protein BHE74_00057040 [Ensete ventricosum]RZS27117.1 hypothetical protein BHM03_00060576 [Ensete ventricosum]